MADTVVEDADRDKIPNEAWENLQREPEQEPGRTVDGKKLN